MTTSDLKQNTALEAALVVISEAARAATDDAQALVAAKCGGLMAGYDARWRDAGYQAIAVERTLTADLANPATNALSRSFRLAGKLDVVAALDGRTVLIDHKTTSEDITDPNAAYWRQLTVEGQVNQYYLLGWANGWKFDQACWDVIRRPSIRPKKLTKAERASVTATGKYFGWPVPSGDVQELAFASDAETLGMYAARLAHDCTVERPEWYFQRRAVPRIDREILEYAGEAWQHSQDMLYSRRALGTPPRNSGACMAYGSPCKFLGICSGHDEPTSDNWRRKEILHPELGDVPDGLAMLTNSRIRCFQSCRRKHYYEYENPIERYDDEEREVIYFGRLLHEALEAWWKCFLTKENDNGNCADGSAASGVADSSTA